jgi:hypothetical protein
MSMAAWAKSNLNPVCRRPLHCSGQDSSRDGGTALHLSPYALMKIIALIGLAHNVTPDQLASYASEEARTIWSGVERQLVREVHYRTDKPGAVIEFEAASTAEAESFIRSLPMHRAGLIEISDLVPVGPYTGLAALFAR